MVLAHAETVASSLLRASLYQETHRDCLSEHFNED